MIFLFKKDDFSVSEIYWKGSFIYRDLQKYVKMEHAKTILILSYTGIASFLCCILSILIYILLVR